MTSVVVDTPYPHYKFYKNRYIEKLSKFLAKLYEYDTHIASLDILKINEVKSTPIHHDNHIKHLGYMMDRRIIHYKIKLRCYYLLSKFLVTLLTLPLLLNSKTVEILFV